jgi:hypothetical protein
MYKRKLIVAEKTHFNPSLGLQPLMTLIKKK